MFDTLARDLAATAASGRRELVFVTSRSVSLSAPHAAVASAANIVALLRDSAFGDLDVPHLPSVISADVTRDRSVFDALAGGAKNLLDVATGILWDHDPRSADERADAAAAAIRATIPEHQSDALRLAYVIQRPLARPTTVFVVPSFHRTPGGVVLDRVGVDDGTGNRLIVEGHDEGVAKLEEVFRRGLPIVMTSSMDALDACCDAGVRLPQAVQDPALACVVLDPDRRRPPPGLGPMWRALLGRRADRSGPDLHRALDELPGVHEELRASLEREGLLPIFENDVSETIPALATIESEGFRVDQKALNEGLANIEREIGDARDFVTTGPYGSAFRNFDLERAKSEDIAKLIELSDGPLPSSWRVEPRAIDRLALFGNERATAVRLLRALNSVHGWLGRLRGQCRLRTVLEPGATGRWYPHDEALASMPKHVPDAAALRRCLIPESGYCFVAADYAAFEPRLLAHQSGDPTLVAASHARDFYEHLMPLLGLKGDGKRNIAKRAVLAFVNGKTAKSFAESLPLPLADGHRIFSALQRALPVAEEFRQRFVTGSTSQATSLRGWRRLAGETSEKKFARQAFNLTMQGSAADLLRQLLRDLRRCLPTGARLAHQEFDAVVLTCPVAMAPDVERVLKQTMEGVANLTVPLVAKTKSGPTLAAVS